MDTKQITEANRAAWEQAAPLHRSQNMERLKQDFSGRGFSCLNDVETKFLQGLGVAGKDVAHLCCNNGQELLSVKNLGAGRCVGFDGAEGFLAQGRELAEAGDIDCEFVCTDIYKIDPAFDASFDLVTVTIFLTRIGHIRAVIACIAKPIFIGVGLIWVWGIRAIVYTIGDAITVGIHNSCCRA